MIHPDFSLRGIVPTVSSSFRSIGEPPRSTRSTVVPQNEIDKYTRHAEMTETIPPSLTSKFRIDPSFQELQKAAREKFVKETIKDPSQDREHPPVTALVVTRHPDKAQRDAAIDQAFRRINPTDVPYYTSVSIPFADPDSSRNEFQIITTNSKLAQSLFQRAETLSPNHPSRSTPSQNPFLDPASSTPSSRAVSPALRTASKESLAAITNAGREDW